MSFFRSIIFMVIVMSADGMQKEELAAQNYGNNFLALTGSGSVECESGEKMLPLLNYDCIIGLGVASAWPHYLVVR